MGEHAFARYVAIAPTEIRHKDLLHKGEHEPIIEASMFDEVQKQLKKNGRGRGNQFINQHGAILKGILRCSACDHAMVHTFTRKKEKIYRYYSCTQAIKSGRDACPTPNLPAAEIEQAVLDQIRSIGADAEIQNLVIAQIQSGQNKQIEELETNRQQLQRQLSRDHAELGKLAIISDPTGATSRDVVFARGLLWNDSQQVRSAIARFSKPILITSRQMKTKIPWRNAPLALSLDLIASMLDRFNLDVDEIIAILAERSDNPDKSAIEVPTAEDLKLLVRRQIKAEQKTELTDDVLVQAYLQEGSIRKAAEFLTSQTGHFISKDKVQRAVQRSGGIDSLVDGKDSNSIVRGVASQCRDSRGNLLIKEIPAN